MYIIHIFYSKLTEQALWCQHGAVTGKQAQLIWNVLTSNCIHGIAVSHQNNRVSRILGKQEQKAGTGMTSGKCLK